jgi:hypothetical protein
MTRPSPRRDWSDAEAKRTYCRVCGSFKHLELAHTMGRLHDKPKVEGGRTLWVNPHSVIPLCGPFPEGCHGAYDHHQLDILSFLTLQEQAQAVLEAGGIELARRRLAPSLYRKVNV